jgi:ABC-2 type transport system ATP-binding protein
MYSKERNSLMEYILETKNLTKKYGKQFAVKNINIHIVKGQIYGLVGRNGAGKTTILKIISGLSNPTDGGFEIFEKNGQNNPLTRQRVGCLIENPGIYPKMSAKENLKMKCLALGVTDLSIIDELLVKVGLENTGKKGAGNFSLGMRQRLGIALALVGNPDIVVLDEPINGLDPQGIVEVRETIEKLNRESGITFIISSHLLDELSKIANKYGIIHGGQMLAEFTSEELEDKCAKRIELKVDKVDDAVTIFESMGIHEYTVIDDSEIQVFEWLDRTGEITMTLSKAGVAVTEIFIRNETLENYYLNMTGGAQNV